jgi:general secretion pathway protein A
MDRHRVDAALVRRAASEVFDRTVAPRWWAWAGAAAGVAGVAILAAALRMYWHEDRAEPIVAAPTTTTPVAAPPSTDGAVMDAEILLANPTLGANTGDQAFARLFDLWRVNFDAAQGRACEQAAQQGLECVYQKGSFGQLRVLNRPAILSLADTQGQKRQAVLSSLQDDTAHIDLGSGPVKVTLASLSRVWLGEYLIVWRPESLGQPLGQRALARGMQGDEVRSLRRGLAVLDGRDIAPADAQSQSDFYDDELARRIETFQRANRLNVDGIAGVQTQIVLDSIVNSGGAPRLLDTHARTLNSGEPAKSGRDSKASGRELRPGTVQSLSLIRPFGPPSPATGRRECGAAHGCGFKVAAS